MLDTITMSVHPGNQRIEGMRRPDGPRVFVFDFDGTLVDSYSCLPGVYSHIAHKLGVDGNKASELVSKMMAGEDRQDALRNFNRSGWWSEVFDSSGIRLAPKRLPALVEEYWEERANRSIVMERTEETLHWLESRGELALLCSGDGTYGSKKRRIDSSGLGGFFDQTVIVGEDVGTCTQGLKLLMAKYGTGGARVMVFDDKPFPINEISGNIKDIQTVRMEFEGPLKSAWAGECSPTYSIRNISEIRRFVT